MNQHLLRIYNKFDLDEVKSHLLIYGDLAAQCANCEKMELKLEDHNCSACGTEFKYISFRNVKTQIPKVHKIMAQRPGMKVIDFDDYKREIGAKKAKDFLK